MKATILILVAAMILPAAAFAQVNATVSGTVSDATGALIPAAEVTATNINTGIATVQTSNETGSYTFASLQPGTYRITAVLPGFQTQTYQNMLFSQGQQVRLNFTLQVAAAAGQTVEVTANADTALATTSASVGAVLPVQEVRSLPLVVRDVLDLLKTQPGTSGSNFGGLDAQSLNTTRDGLIVSDVRYLRENGAQGGTFVSPDLVEEVQVVIGAVDAEARGSGQIRLQTRSGTNDFHGALFYYNNNSVLSAQNWFSKLRGAKPSYLNRNQYGGRLGGPILKNKAFFFVLVDEQRYLQKESFVTGVLTNEARNGLFRYVSGQRNGNALSATPSVDLNGNILNPTALRSFNLFSDVKDPFRTSISSNAWWRRVLTEMPQPNDYTIGDGLNTAGHRWTRRISGLYGGGSGALGNNNNRDQLNLRFDYQINNANKLSFTGSREKDLATRAKDWPTGFDGQDSYVPHLWTGAWTSTISATTLNEFRIGRKETGFHRRSPFEIGCCYGDTAHDYSPDAQKLFDALPKVNGYPLYPIPGVIDIGVGGDGGNIALHGFDSTRGNINPTIQVADGVNWTLRNHSFKSGFEWVSQWSDGWNTTAEQFPTALLGNGGTPVQGIDGTRFPGLQAADATTAVGILNDLSASIDTLTQGYVINSATASSWSDFLTEPRRFRKFTQNDWDVYFKDTWNATKNLTLNIGLRYDKYGVLYDGHGLLARAKGGQSGIFGISGKDFSALWNPNATGGALTESELVGKNSPNADIPFWKNDWNNIAPSLGFSYKLPWGAESTVVRGGYGINYAGASEILDYELSFGNIPGTVDIERPLQSSFLDLTGAVTKNVLPLKASAQPGRTIIPLTSRTQSFHTMADDRATPYIQSFNLSVQHPLANGLTLEVSYIGNKGTKLIGNIQLNEPNIIENGILQAFNVTRAGGNAPLFTQMLNGLTVPGVGTVDGVSITGSQAFRRFASTRGFLADGSVGQFAAFLNSTAALTGVAGGLLRNAHLPENYIVVNPQFGTAQLWGTNKNTTYHSLQTQLKKQIGQGFSAQTSYTFAKALGDSVAPDITTTTIDPRNRSLNKGRLSFDHTHTIKAFGTWDLPVGPGQTFLSGAPKFIGRIVENWQLSSIFTYTSGSPLNITSPVRTVGSANNLSLPDIVGAFPKSLGEVHVADGFVEYFTGISTRKTPTSGLYGADPDNLASLTSNRDVVDSSGNIVLTNPQPGKVGTLGTRWVEGPGQMGLDLSLSKRILVREGTTFTVRADALNALNTPQWGDPNVDINSTSFGRITSATGERRITISGRLDF